MCAEGLDESEGLLGAGLVGFGIIVNNLNWRHSLTSPSPGAMKQYGPCLLEYSQIDILFW